MWHADKGFTTLAVTGLLQWVVQGCSLVAGVQMSVGWKLQIQSLACPIQGFCLWQMPWKSWAWRDAVNQRNVTRSIFCFSIMQCHILCSSYTWYLILISTFLLCSLLNIVSCPPKWRQATRSIHRRVNPVLCYNFLKWEKTLTI